MPSSISDELSTLSDRQLRRLLGARTFLRGLRAIGATTAACGHRPLAAGDLRRVMKRFEQSGSRVTYEVVTCHYGVGVEASIPERR